MTSRAARLAALPADERAELLDSLGPAAVAALADDWRFWARPEQLAPPGEWTVWLVNAGRGFGKTRAGSEWVHEIADANPDARIALVARTRADARDVMVEGESGVLATAKASNPCAYQPMRRRIVWANGARATTYSAKEPGQLRGPQHTHAWADEVAAWDRAETWSNLSLGLRLGDHPRLVATTTPRPTSLIRTLDARGSDPDDVGVVVTGGSTYANAANLAPAFLDEIRRKYEGTTLGAQEIHARILDEVEGARWTRSMIEGGRVQSMPDDLDSIIVAIDPAVTSKAESDETGIIAAGRKGDEFYVLRDATRRASPDAWLRSAVALLDDLEGDRLVGEVNNGGDLIESLLRHHSKRVPFSAVRASRGKVVRAEPVVALYEQGRVHHVGALPELEDQMVTWTADVDWSPDRVDALVWAISALAERKGGRLSFL